MISVLLMAGLAFGQDSIDAHGFSYVPSDGDNQDLVTMWRAEKHAQGDFSMAVMGEFADKTLEFHRVDENGEYVSEVVDDLWVANVGTSYAATDWLNLTAAVPMYMAGETPANMGLMHARGVVGDIRLAAPISLFSEQKGHERYDALTGIRYTYTEDYGISFVPIVDLATGAERFLSASGPSVGAVLAGSLAVDNTEVSANIGVMSTPRVELLNLQGGGRLLVALGVSQRLTDDVSLLLELDQNPNFRLNQYVGTDSPGEFLAAFRGGDKETSWTIGGATTTSKGVGAASARAFVGFEMLLSKKPLINLTDPHPAPENLLEPAELDCPDCPEATPFDVGERLNFGPVYFDFDKATIRIPESSETLMKAVTTLETWPEITMLMINGHTDERGSDEYNWTLSEQRIEAVATFLADHGIDRQRLAYGIYGELDPIYPDCDTNPWFSPEDCHQANRRIEFEVLELE